MAANSPPGSKNAFWVWCAIFALEALVSPVSSCKKIMRPGPIRIEGPFWHGEELRASQEEIYQHGTVEFDSSTASTVSKFRLESVLLMGNMVPR